MSDTIGRALLRLAEGQARIAAIIAEAAAEIELETVAMLDDTRALLAPVAPPLDLIPSDTD